MASNKNIPAITPITMPAMAPPDNPPVLASGMAVPLLLAEVAAAVLAAVRNVCVVEIETDTTAVIVVAVPEVFRCGPEGEVVGAAAAVAVHIPGA